eukprot:CAMPEP_0119103074 /NCGR_PEP_ID=MMETSP1180-20130426/1621_1 /TAXON_ID=3052 ORGANISM="Chlamydomonas cf sp, Strain CCMP681" /NCGR_SAMPLE_ID=MMETSP1180 /ASSEMBLY_ACC=CAM_ASM_000741 /LENGTH=329 /DNA_ID=CAMNT_0007087501 /DNA_START=15 /DNA_END=1004 /DNA_ORIENTATION=-
MYIMGVEQQKWEKQNVEGTLYLLKRRSNPRFQILVLNKLSTENYTEAVEGGFHAELNPPYLMYTQGNGKLHGVWFYDEAELHKMAALLEKVEAALPKTSSEEDPSPPQTQQAPGEKAQQKRNIEGDGFWDRPAHPEDVAMRQQQANAAIQGNGQHVLTNLFSKAQAKPQQPQPAPPAQAVHPPATTGVPFSPAYFIQGQIARLQMGQGQLAQAGSLDLRSVALLPGDESGDLAGVAAAVTEGPENPLAKLFKKAAPAQHTELARQVPATVVARHHLQAPAPSNLRPQTQAPLQGTQQEELLRAALSRLVQRPEFITMLAGEMRAVGLLG